MQVLRTHFASSGILSMARERDRDEPSVPSWDGEVSSWPEYSRRVRLSFAQTPVHKRYTVAPKLVLKLRGRAWEAAANIDHSRLTQNTGTQYLLQFLKDRLGRLPIPDIGQNLDDLFVRAKRQPGTDLVSWCNQIRETYKRLQRSLAKTRTTTSVGVQTDSPAPGTASSSPTSRRRLSGSEPLREPEERPTTAVGAEEAMGEEHPDATSPTLHSDDDEAYGGDDWWQRSRWHGWRDWRDYRDWYGHQLDEDDEEMAWLDLEGKLPDILPEEVLGWLLMRRSNLPSAAKLAIQASSQNSLKFQDIERSMRQQEDELLFQERHRPMQPKNHGRNYWVEDSGQWGLVVNEPEDMDGFDEEQISWIDEEAFLAMMSPQDAAETETSWYSDGWYDWCWHEDDWHAFVDGVYYTWGEMKPWLEVDEIAAVDSEAGKEVKDLYAAFEQKIRTFKEARDHVHQKGKNRGFYPYTQKGGPKGKGKTKKGGKGSSFMATTNQKGKGSASSSQPSSSSGTIMRPGYTGCFVCGG